MSEKHSPRPWRVTENNGSADIFDAGQCLVATVHPENEDLGADSYLATDARLIAAAPEMLALLRRAVATCDGVRRACHLGTCEHGDIEELIERIDGKVG